MTDGPEESSSATPNDQIDYAKTILEHNWSMVSADDTKASIITGINGVILVLVLSSDYFMILSKLMPMWVNSTTCISLKIFS